MEIIHKELEGNEKIEEAILAVQKTPSNETLAQALTAIRRQMVAGAHLIVSVDQIPEEEQLSLRTIDTADGKRWFAAFTGYEEQLMGSNPIMSTFTAPIGQLLETTLAAEMVDGVILNPWNRTMALNKQLIAFILEEKHA
ncbi:MAG: SseB family protein [Lachnospiraceae bacterium]|nr:SseB family protein [Lachnospiraceae bacterium]